MTKEILLRLKDSLYEPLKKVKENTGIAISNQIYRYIYKGMLSEGLVGLDELKEDK